MRKTIFFVLLLAAVPALARRHRKPEFRAFPTSPDSLVLQNAEVDRRNLPRIKNREHLRELIGSGELVPFPVTPALRVHIPKERAYARPDVVTLVTSLADDFYRTFGKPLQVNSAVRTLQDQKRLRRWNRNAAPVSGPKASVHPTGLAVDLQRRGLKAPELRWLQFRLLYLSARGQALVEEELRNGSCFHVVARASAYEIMPILAHTPESLFEVTGETFTALPSSAIVGPMSNEDQVRKAPGPGFEYVPQTEGWAYIGLPEPPEVESDRR